jgi:hypothetical protein
MNDAEFVQDEALPNCERIGIQRRANALLDRRPQCCLPCVRGVNEVGILAEVDVVDQPLTSLPEQGRALPDVMLGDESDDAPLARGVVGGEELGDCLGALATGQIDVLVG